MWDGGFASTTDEAKEIFNVGMRKLRQGLAFYPLEDGENLVHHCNIILEISQLYRCNNSIFLITTGIHKVMPHVLSQME